MKRHLVHLIPFLILFSFMAPVAGVRHIWQDEAETAERARSILAYGVPRVVDPEGRLSVNAGGKEIEEGTLHRYTPWGQFYVGAAGLAIGRKLGLSEDTGIRLPFVFLHAASSSVLSYGLVSALGWPVAASVGISTLFGIQTVRVLNNRSARYHALLDFLVLVALLGVSMRGQRAGLLLLGVSLFLLPQAHTLGGSVLASTIVVILFVDSWMKTKSFSSALKLEFWRSILPSVLSVLCILVLCRPWLQTAWTSVTVGRFRFSLNSTLEIGYAFYPILGWLIFLVWKKQWRETALISLMLGYIFAVVKVLEANPWNQPRYYLAVPILLLFWPLLIGLPPFLNSRKLVVAIFAFSALLSDAQGIVPYFQGIRVVVSDYSLKSETQPLAAALSSVPKGSPILIDYVPQFVNWYLRANPIALMPRPILKTKLASANPLFDAKRIEPDWHIGFTKQKAVFPCDSGPCDYHRSDIIANAYDLEVAGDASNPHESIHFCILKTWPVDRWNNAPFSGYNPHALDPGGDPNDILILARKCSK